MDRLGRYKATKGPGFNLIMPLIAQLIDTREQVIDVSPQEVITSNDVVVSVDVVVYYEATDPQRLVHNVADFFTAITRLAQRNLRNLIGDLEPDTALPRATDRAPGLGRRDYLRRRALAVRPGHVDPG